MRKNLIKIIFVAASIVTTFLVFGAWNTPAKTETSTKCPESMDQCCKKSNSAESTIWETSNQFFTSIGVN
jgi:hypothetical protein